MMFNAVIKHGDVYSNPKKISGNGRGGVYDIRGIAPTIVAMSGGGNKPMIVVEAKERNNNLEVKISHTEIPCIYDDRDKGFGKKTTDICPTMRASRSGLKVIGSDDMSNYRIRKLTPKECWRLQGFSDEAFDRARDALNEKCYGGKDRSSSQLYKQAGNSICTDVLYHIYQELYKAMPYLFTDLKVSSFFSGIGAFEVALDRLFEDISNAEV